MKVELGRNTWPKYFGSSTITPIAKFLDVPLVFRMLFVGFDHEIHSSELQMEANVVAWHNFFTRLVQEGHLENPPFHLKGKPPGMSRLTQG
jgi:hypothetical protein